MDELDDYETTPTLADRPNAAHVTINGPVEAVAAVRAWITARGGQTATSTSDHPHTPGWALCELTVDVQPED